jgi:hypothetical protein
MIFSRYHQDALELDVSVLSLLLRRNEPSHRRARYYQHLRTALRFLSKSTELLRLYPRSTEFAERVGAYLASHRTKSGRRKVFWELDDLPPTKNLNSKASRRKGERDGDDDAVCEATSTDASELSELQDWHEWIVESMSEPVLSAAFSRIGAAANLLWSEIARGFFLPFCTVAVAALARIRALLVQLVGHVSRVILPAASGHLHAVLLERGAANRQRQSLFEEGPASSSDARRLSVKLAKIQAFLETQETHPSSSLSSSLSSSRPDPPRRSASSSSASKLGRRLARVCQELSIPLPARPRAVGALDHRIPRPTVAVGASSHEDLDDPDGGVGSAGPPLGDIRPLEEKGKAGGEEEAGKIDAELAEDGGAVPETNDDLLRLLSDEEDDDDAAVDADRGVMTQKKVAQRLSTFLGMNLQDERVSEEDAVTGKGVGMTGVDPRALDDEGTDEDQRLKPNTVDDQEDVGERVLIEHSGSSIRGLAVPQPSLTVGARRSLATDVQDNNLAWAAHLGKRKKKVRKEKDPPLKIPKQGPKDSRHDVASTTVFASTMGGESDAVPNARKPKTKKEKKQKRDLTVNDKDFFDDLFASK